MGTPSSGPNQAVLSCDDSGLSMTGNIVGIFTFAAALYVAPSIRVELFRRSHQRYTDLIADVSSSLRKLMHTYSRIHHHLEATASDTARTEERMAIQSKINDIYHMPGNAGGLLQKLITPVLSTEYGTWSTWINDLLGRVRFVLREHELQDIREKARRAVETLNEVAADVLVKYISTPRPLMTSTINDRIQRTRRECDKVLAIATKAYRSAQ